MFWANMFAPFVSKRSMHFMYPVCAALWRAVSSLMLSVAFTSAPALMRKLTFFNSLYLLQERTARERMGMLDFALKLASAPPFSKCFTSDALFRAISESDNGVWSKQSTTFTCWRNLFDILLPSHCIIKSKLSVKLKPLMTS